MLDGYKNWKILLGKKKATLAPQQIESEKHQIDV